MTNWKEYIVSDKAVLLGKPCIKGTRLSVEFLLKLLANGWSEEQILKNYPRLSRLFNGGRQRFGQVPSKCQLLLLWGKLGICSFFIFL